METSKSLEPLRPLLFANVWRYHSHTRGSIFLQSWLPSQGVFLWATPATTVLLGSRLAGKNGHTQCACLHILCTPSLPLPGPNFCDSCKESAVKSFSYFPSPKQRRAPPAMACEDQPLECSTSPSLHSRLQSPALLPGPYWRHTPYL